MVTLELVNGHTELYGATAVNVITIYNIVNAPYAGIDANITEKLNFSGSIRYDNVNDGTLPMAIHKVS
jgi:hypothetical protein